MNAGTSATIVDPSIDRHYTNPNLPYRPRVLSRGERTRRETFVFYSPKSQRVVTVCEFIGFALALQLEFSPAMAAYVERPRRLALAPKHEIDVSFWARDKSGEEFFYLAIPSAGTIASTRGVASIKDRALLDEVALRHGIKLTYKTEHDLIAAGAQINAYFLLLPHVQSARRILDRAIIRKDILAFLQGITRASFRQLIAVQENVDSSSVVAVAASMVHDGTLRLVDHSLLSQDSMLEVAHEA